MRIPTPNDSEMMATIERYLSPEVGGWPWFMELLHANFLALPERERSGFGRELGLSARQVTDRELTLLLDYEWRSRLTAAWLIGVDRRTQFRERLANMLLESELVYAGEGYCFALARFADESDARHLVAYLERYLPDPQCYYNQDWAMGALLHLDERLGTDFAGRFLTRNGPWAGSAMRGKDPAEFEELMNRMCSFAEAIAL